MFPYKSRGAYSLNQMFKRLVLHPKTVGRLYLGGPIQGNPLTYTSYINCSNHNPKKWPQQPYWVSIENCCPKGLRKQHTIPANKVWVQFLHYTELSHICDLIQKRLTSLAPNFGANTWFMARAFYKDILHAVSSHLCPSQHLTHFANIVRINSSACIFISWNAYHSWLSCSLALLACHWKP